jgi:hypothetical protein
LSSYDSHIATATLTAVTGGCGHLTKVDTFACSRPYTFDVLVDAAEDAWQLYAAFDGTISVTRFTYESGIGVSGSDNYAVPCSLLDSLTSGRIRLRLTMGQYVDYFYPAGDQTVCEMLREPGRCNHSFLLLFNHSLLAFATKHSLFIFFVPFLIVTCLCYQKYLRFYSFVLLYLTMHLLLAFATKHSLSYYFILYTARHHYLHLLPNTHPFFFPSFLILQRHMVLALNRA